MKNWSINKVGGGGIYQFPLYILLIISLLFILCHVCISTNRDNTYKHVIINTEGRRGNILKVGAPKTFIELSTWRLESSLAKTGWSFFPAGTHLL